MDVNNCPYRSYSSFTIFTQQDKHIIFCFGAVKIMYPQMLAMLAAWHFGPVSLNNYWFDSHEMWNIVMMWAC